MREIQCRDESIVFEELKNLAQSVGYIYAYVYLIIQNNLITYSPEKGLSEKDFENLYTKERLIRTELTTLLGLIVQKEISLKHPGPDIVQNYILKTSELLSELHNCLIRPFNLNSAKIEMNGAMVREAVFYAADSAYPFQYKLLAGKRYFLDSKWFKDNVGFDIVEALEILSFIELIRDEKFSKLHESFNDVDKLDNNVLESFIITEEEIVIKSGLDSKLISNFLKCFSVESPSNEAFYSLSNFNLLYSKPLIAIGSNKFLFFNSYSLVESFYESPFYWMISDPLYKETALRNRGNFTEDCTYELAKKVFGNNNVFKNVFIKSGTNILGEVDVLIKYSSFIFIIQTKSKRLTLEAKKGNDKIIKEDFKKSVQDSYDQAYLCAEKILENKYAILYEEGVLELTNVEEVYPLSIISDHYPSLNFQIQYYLNLKKHKVIKPPLVLDLFTFDAVTELLESPLHFINYIQRRSRHYDKMTGSNEMAMLASHIRANLWLTTADTLLYFTDDIVSSLSVALIARRENHPGPKVPEGFFKKSKEGFIGKFLRNIEASENPLFIEIGIALLKISGEQLVVVSKAFEQMVQLTFKDGKNHDFSIPISFESGGLTFHSNPIQIERAIIELQEHCEYRKYVEKADSWIGVLIDPGSLKIRKAIKLKYTWKFNESFQTKSKFLVRNEFEGMVITSKVKRGRNDECICGSGKKFKKCCLT